MGMIAPMFSLLGSVMGMMGGGGSQPAAAPAPPPPPQPPQVKEPEGAADAEVAKRRSLSRQADRKQQGMIDLEEVDESVLKRPTLLSGIQGG